MGRERRNGSGAAERAAPVRVAPVVERGALGACAGDEGPDHHDRLLDATRAQKVLDIHRDPSEYCTRLSMRRS